MLTTMAFEIELNMEMEMEMEIFESSDDARMGETVRRRRRQRGSWCTSSCVSEGDATESQTSTTEIVSKSEGQDVHLVEDVRDDDDGMGQGSARGEVEGRKEGKKERRSTMASNAPWMKN
jgi:hypothetical protein